MKEWLIKTALALAAVFLPIKAALITVLVLVVADLIMGLACAIKTKTPITSSGLRSTATKLFVYEIVIMLAFLAETYLIGPDIQAVKIVSGLIGVSEIKSILENADTLSGGKMFKALIEKLKS